MRLERRAHVALWLAISVAMGCGGGGEGPGVEDGAGLADAQAAEALGAPDGFVPGPVPGLEERVPTEQAPVHVFLYMHTEDHINHDLSEERYLRIAPVVGEVAAEHPASGLVWTVMFQGADAKTVAERNAETGVVDLLKEHAAQGVVDFGYHAHHDPTYQNRPQKDFSAESTWEELVTGMDLWVSCEKEPYVGGCVPGAPPGGVLAVVENFGPVGAVSGVYTFSVASVEGGAGRHAVRRHLPERLVGLGFPDHGPADDAEDYGARLAELMTVLTPTTFTTGAALWVDDVIKLNDGNPLDGIGSIVVKEGVETAAKKLAGLDRTRSQIINAHMGDKYLYTGSGTSPTKWAYANPTAPELPPEHLLSKPDREMRYKTTFETLEWLAGEFLGQNAGGRFLRAADIVEMVAPPAYWVLSREEVDVLARWALLHWDGGPPPWVSDGTRFYSIRDLFVLLVLTLDLGLPGSIDLSMAYGPLSRSDASGEATTLSAEEIYEVVGDLAVAFAGGGAWEETPPNIIPAEIEVGGRTASAAQLLYAMAIVYSSTVAEVPVTQVDIPGGRSMPETLEMLEGLGCPACEGTSWSLKPARID